MFAQTARVNALPVNQSDRPTQCFDCHQWGHRRTECPNKPKGNPFPRAIALAQRNNAQNQNNNQAKKANPAQVQNAKVNHVTIDEIEEEQDEIYAALDPSSNNRQYSILEVQGEY